MSYSDRLIMQYNDCLIMSHSDSLTLPFSDSLSVTYSDRLVMSHSESLIISYSESLIISYIDSLVPYRDYKCSDRVLGVGGVSLKSVGFEFDDIRLCCNRDAGERCGPKKTVHHTKES